MSNKKGSHVGMIISFVIFVTFIIFLYTIVRPVVKVGQDKKTIADYLVVKIVENVSSDFNSTSVEIWDKPITQSCVKLTGFFVLVVKNGIAQKTIVRDEDQIKRDSYTDSSADLIIFRENQNNYFFKIYSSSEYNPLITCPLSVCPDSSCHTVSQNNYKIAVIKYNKYPFKNNIDFLMTAYKNNYESLKESLNIPPGTEFGFGFTESNGIRADVGEAPESADVYAEEIPIQYADDKANILSGFINIKVW